MPKKIITDPLRQNRIDRLKVNDLPFRSLMTGTTKLPVTVPNANNDCRVILNPRF